jgi:hypothetical protein
MSILESKINSIGAIALETSVRLNNNYYDKVFIDTFLTAGGGGQTVNDLLLLYYNKVTVNSLLSNYQTVGNYLTSGSLIGYATIGGVPTNYLTSGSLIGYLTSGSLLGYVTTGSIPTNYLTSGSLIGYVTTGSIPTNYLTSGSLVGYAPRTNPVFTGTITTNFLNVITPENPNDIIINNKFIPTAAQLAAQLTLSGGGIVSWSGTHLKWGSRVYVSPVSKPELALDGIYYIDCPLSGRVLTRYTATGTNSVTVTNDGIPLSAWEALYWFNPASATLAGGAVLNFFIVNC